MENRLFKGMPEETRREVLEYLKSKVVESNVVQERANSLSETLNTKDIRCSECDKLINFTGERAKDNCICMKKENSGENWRVAYRKGGYGNYDAYMNNLDDAVKTIEDTLKKRPSNMILDKFTEKELWILENAVHQKEDFLNELDSIKFHLDEHRHEESWINGQGNEPTEYLEEAGIVRKKLNALTEDEGDQLYKFLVQRKEVEEIEVAE